MMRELDETRARDMNEGEEVGKNSEGQRFARVRRHEGCRGG